MSHQSSQWKVSPLGSNTGALLAVVIATKGIESQTKRRRFNRHVYRRSPSLEIVSMRTGGIHPNEAAIIIARAELGNDIRLERNRIGWCCVSVAKGFGHGVAEGNLHPVGSRSSDSRLTSG